MSTEPVTSSTLYPNQPLENQVVLITGATAGIGLSTAWRFAEHKCKLLLVGRRTERLQELKESLLKVYPETKILPFTLDICDSAALAAFPVTLETDYPEFKDVDILVNNAGCAIGRSPAYDQKIEDVNQMVMTNVIALISLSNMFLKGMYARKSGHLINVSSIAAHEMYPGGSVYNATKAAVTAFTYATRMDCVSTPIRITAISPGMVNTEFSLVRFKGDQSAADNTYTNIVVLNANDVADNIIYAATRPKHVQIADIIVYPTNQGSTTLNARMGDSLGAL